MVPVIAFWALAIVMVGSALMVISTRNVFHAALFLVATLGGVAAIYVMLNADFLAAVQLILYVGAIAVLLIFGIMLTRDVIHSNLSNHMWHVGLVPAAALLLVLTLVFTGTDWEAKAPSTEPTAAPLADALFSTYLLPFEVASVLLLAAIIGAIVIAKES